jgi:hypothetical protein
MSGQVRGEVEEADGVERLRDDEEVILVRVEDRGLLVNHLRLRLEGRVVGEKFIGPIKASGNGNQDDQRNAESDERHAEVEAGEVSGDQEADGDGAQCVSGLRDSVGEPVVATGQVVHQLDAGMKVEGATQPQQNAETKKSINFISLLFLQTDLNILLNKIVNNIHLNVFKTKLFTLLTKFNSYIAYVILTKTIFFKTVFLTKTE